MIRFLLAMLMGMIETKVPESATQVSYVLVDLSSTLPLMSGDALFLCSLEILIFFILSISGLVGGFRFGGDVS